MKDKKYAVIGCGFLGSKIAKHLNKTAEVTVTATTRTKQEARRALGFECELLKIGAPDAYYQFIENQDGICICLAPTSVGETTEECYRKTYETDLNALVEAFKQRNAIRHTHITYISSTAVYGDQFGSVVDEGAICDLSHAANQILHKAEQEVLSLSNSSTTVAVLRLGGLYNEQRDMLEIFKNLSGKRAQQVGKFHPAWTHTQDAARAVKFAFENNLSGIYNVNNDMMQSYTEISYSVSEEFGLAPTLYNTAADNSYRISNAKVSNQKLKSEGFEFEHPTFLKPTPAFIT